MSNDLEQQLVRALKEIEALKQENRSLKLQLSNYIVLEDPTSQTPSLPQIANEQEQTSIGHVHLKSSSEEKIGVYPMLQDETCWFLAMDFDKQNWQQDAAAVLATCKEWHIPAALERSRSGNGGHVWFFFNQPLEAVIARKLGCAILTKTMERRYQISLDSYDRLFPNQDTLPRGGFGNLRRFFVKCRLLE